MVYVNILADKIFYISYNTIIKASCNGYLQQATFAKNE